MEPWSEYAKFFAALLAIVNPLGAIPIFVNLTASQSTSERYRSGTIAAFSALAVLLVSLLTGEMLLNFFGITIGSFRVAGGILLLLMAISMLQARVSATKQTPEEAADSAGKDQVGVVPLGLPLLAGPGAISTVILYSQKSGHAAHYALLVLGIVVTCVTTWICFRAAPTIAVWLGRTGINIVTRIMGLIMASIGVEFIANGLRQLFPELAGG